MRSRARVALGLGISLLLSAPAAAGPKKSKVPDEGLRLQDNLPKDPLIAGAFILENPAKTFDETLELLAKFGDEEDQQKIDQGLKDLDEKLGFSLRNDLLAQIGPEFAVILDLPPLDEATEAFMGAAVAGGGDAIANVFGKVGILMRLRDGGRVDRSLRALFAHWKGEVSELEGLVRVKFGASRVVEEQGQEQEGGPPGPPVPQLHLFYGIREGLLALGLSPDWVRDSLAGQPGGARLSDGKDYARVFSHLDPKPASLTYLNLPKLMEWIRGSQFVQGMVASNPEGKKVFDTFLTPELMGVGLGSTSVKTDGGVRTTSFGPEALSGGVFSSGLIAAIAIPNLLNAIDRGKAKRTTADMRSIGTVCEAYAVDNNRYPGPTDGWVAIEAIASEVEPIYIRTLPRVDGWGNEILFWSDGESYRLVSPGKDGELEQDWSGEIEPETTSDPDRDIVFGDGQFLLYPEGTAH